MSKTTSYKIRRGNIIPIVDNLGVVVSVFVWTFGKETQQVDLCESQYEVASSNDMCLLNKEDTAYFSAQYKAQPGKICKKLVFNSVVTHKPVLDGAYIEDITYTDLCDF